MGEETISVGETEDGSDVELPVVDLLTGRGFITGKSGSGKSNSASVIAEKILDRGYSLLAVDIDGEYYGLKEEYEILHVGADEECDLRVGVEHAEKIAELALGQNVPIILDVSSFLDESDARELLTEVTKQLFAKEKKMKQPFLMLVEEVHEYIPEGGGVDECGRMLIKVSKRGRKHGLGIVGISQRPADVKKDFITQCDWLVWHRLTWNNDTKVVGRILGNEYAGQIEDMDDGESFLMTDWNESIRRVQFERKRTFDAGATPGLDDFERPELKSVSGDLVDELQEITDERESKQNRINELERQLQQRDERIRDLQRQLSDARDLKQMADRFSRAMIEQVTGRPLSVAPGRQSELDEAVAGRIERDPELEAELDAVRNGERDPTPPPVPDARSEREANASGEDTDQSNGEDVTEVANPSSGGVDGSSDTSMVFNRSPPVTGEVETDTEADADTDSGLETDPDIDGLKRDPTTGLSAVDAPATGDPLVSRLRDDIESLDDVSADMLRQYRRCGPMEPQDAHSKSGGSGDRAPAYAANRGLRQRGLIAHVGCGKYDYALAELVREELTNPLRPEEPPGRDEIDETVEAIERAVESDRSDQRVSNRPESVLEEPSPDAEWPSVGF
ncbi:MAG: helicase HerA domain-containing protein [Halobacteriota archaeon]|uniref:helicase HerA domain-containing protein n=1 Tax=Natronomonas sp. TaxID=2184060 RepID=UPI003975D2BC